MKSKKLWRRWVGSTLQKKRHPKKFNKKTVVFVPKDTSINRIKAIKSFNAIVYQLDLNYEETCAYASKKCDENGWKLVQDASWENYEEIPSLIMSGYLTHFKEIEFPTKTNIKSKFDVIFLLRENSLMLGYQ